MYALLLSKSRCQGLGVCSLLRDDPARSGRGWELQGCVVAAPRCFAHLVTAENYRAVCGNAKAGVSM